MDLHTFINTDGHKYYKYIFHPYIHTPNSPPTSKGIRAKRETISLSDIVSSLADASAFVQAAHRTPNSKDHFHSIL
jgi:hypothetical protein